MVIRSLAVLICLLLIFLAGTSIASQLKVRADGSVYDQRSGLIWQQADSGRLLWLDAVRYCNQLDLADSRSWRLPFKDELKTLHEAIGSGDQLDLTAFPAAQAEVYWALNREEQQPDKVWGVSFADGKEYMFDRNKFNFLSRCLIETTEALYLPLVNKWAEAWSAQDVAAYLACYGQGFEPAKGLLREEWVAQRKQRLKRPKSIQVKISDLRVISERGDRAEISFRQMYRSDNYADQVSKVLTLAIERGELVIVGERTISQIK